MQAMRFFIDTHDSSNQTFPEKLTREEFETFYTGYEAACFEEGVVPIRIHVGYEEGRAFCLNMAPDADTVKRVHEKVGLPFDTITEVTMATPGDMFFKRHYQG